MKQLRKYATDNICVFALKEVIKQNIIWVKILAGANGDKKTFIPILTDGTGIIPSHTRYFFKGIVIDQDWIDSDEITPLLLSTGNDLACKILQEADENWTTLDLSRSLLMSKLNLEKGINKDALRVYVLGLHTEREYLDGKQYVLQSAEFLCKIAGSKNINKELEKVEIYVPQTKIEQLKNTRIVRVSYVPIADEDSEIKALRKTYKQLMELKYCSAEQLFTDPENTEDQKVDSTVVESDSEAAPEQTVTIQDLIVAKQVEYQALLEKAGWTIKYDLSGLPENTVHVDQSRKELYFSALGQYGVYQISLFLQRVWTDCRYNHPHPLDGIYCSDFTNFLDVDYSIIGRNE